MKRVRFQTPTRGYFGRMEERECHSPRPFLQKVPSVPSNVEVLNQYQRLPYFDDPVERYESSDSSPYLKASKTQVHDAFAADSNWRPSNDLELSMLDASNQEPRQPIRRPTILPCSSIQTCVVTPKSVQASRNTVTSPVLSPIQNEHQRALNVTPPNVLSKENSFFIRRENLDKYQMSTHLLANQFSKLKLGKEICLEKSPATKKAEMFTGTVMSPIEPQRLTVPQINLKDRDCRCHHCVQSPQSKSQAPQQWEHLNKSPNHQQSPYTYQTTACPCCAPPPIINKACQCHPGATPPTKNAVDKKTWAIQKFEKGKSHECLEMSKQANVTKEKREPTVADLFKIIKLQNEQLQLLQEKVDKFLTGNNNIAAKAQSRPVTNYVTEHVALQTIDHEQHKISIGVMTSFEMVHTSTVINKEIVTHTTKNAHEIQCNRSQISIKEVVTKPVNLNFLEGLAPNQDVTSEKARDIVTNEQTRSQGVHHTAHMNDEKTLNEMSLYNVQVDNATTPQLSPEQTMYLDVRDYSDSESSGNSSPVGWTYYNKVMTHVNGMLQDSEMPSSASAMCRNTRQQFVQMQIDKTNVSVTKRVKFGDDPLGIHQPHLYQATTDTSLKMNQLAAKYLKARPALPAPPKVVTPVTRPAAPIDMSLATRNYMERHKLIKGTPAASSPLTQPGGMPRFLDITALKQQTKLL